MITSGVHNAEKRDRRPALQLVEHKVWRICRDETKVSARADEQVHPGAKILGQIVQPPGVKHRDSLIDIKAVDDDVWISGLRLSGTKARTDGAVVVDSRLRPEPADHARSSHATEQMHVWRFRIPSASTVIYG